MSKKFSQEEKDFKDFILRKSKLPPEEREEENRLKRFRNGEFSMWSRGLSVVGLGMFILMILGGLFWDIGSPEAWNKPLILLALAFLIAATCFPFIEKKFFRRKE